MRSDRRSPVRVHLVSATRLYQEGLRGALEDGGRVSVAAASIALPRAAELREHAIELVLIDATGGSRQLAVLHAQAPDVPIVTLGVDPDSVVAYAGAGAVGFVPREASIEQLVAAIEEVVREGASCPARLVARLLTELTANAAGRTEIEEKLTARESEVVALVRRGCSNKEIAYELGIELTTVKNHIHNILEKLRLDSRADVALLARERAELDLDLRDTSRTA
jgi:DNA-binding NarL/FixJ family response regulator